MARHPRKRKLCRCTALLLCQLLDFFDNGLVFVEVLALELRYCAAEVILCEIVGGFVVEVVYQPTVAERRKGNVGNVQFSCGVNEATRLVAGFEGGVFGLDGVNWGDGVGFA